MAINNPLVVCFGNERIRPAARKFAELVEWAQGVLLEVTPEVLTHLGVNLTLLTQVDPPSDADYAALVDVIVDGAATDGRSTMTNGDVLRMLRVIRFFLGAASADDNYMGKLARRLAFGS